MARRGRRASKDRKDGRILKTRLTVPKLKFWERRSFVPAQAQAYKMDHQLDSLQFRSEEAHSLR